MKDPAVLFYTADFLTGTFTMTNEQVGKYIRLLCLQHQQGFICEKDMLNICNSYDEDIYSKFMKENGKYYNQRMKFEAEKRKKYSESRSENRKHKSEKPLKSIKKTSKKDMLNISKTYDKHMENENENINENINIKYTPDFISFWEVYPKKKSKDKAFEYWQKKKGKPPITEIIAKLQLQIKSEDWKKDNGKFIPYPGSYINAGGWYDEITIDQKLPLQIKPEIKYEPPKEIDANAYIKKIKTS